ncbi:hypothetical protein [Candidatus Kuenenia sp.]|uniref:hypothetical protein n=1 Tax=Candidatus Kuenenia sp. TaxID=2499824 RepID=UPI00321FBF4D
MLRLQGINNKYIILNLAIKDLGLSAFINFIGINLRFFTENTLNALVFFNIIQADNPANRYDIHTPSPPDMTGDAATIITLTIAYLFFASHNVRNALNVTVNNNDNMDTQYIKAVKHLEACYRWVKNFFLVTVAGFGLYFFSKYVLSTGIDVVFVEGNAISNILGIVSSLIQICSPFIFVYAYCKYVFANTTIALLLYTFFFIRNLFATGLLGFVTYYDLHVVASFLDWLTILILLYSIGCIMLHHCASKLFHKV